MEKKIFNTLTQLLNKRTNIDDATDQLLHLFSVSKRFNFPNFIISASGKNAIFIFQRIEEKIFQNLCIIIHFLNNF